jgi:hypothetical protein
MLGVLALVAVLLTAGCGGGGGGGGGTVQGTGTTRPSGVERLRQVIGELGAAIQKLAGKPEETLAPPKPVVLGEATSGRLPPCSGMDTTARELGAARASRVVKCLVDGVRAKPLRTSGKLVKAASRHANRMIQAKFFNHEDPADKSHVTERVRRTGYLQGIQGWGVGENLAWGTGVASTPAGIVRAWLNSPGHRRNIMDRRWTQTGVATVMSTPQGAAGATFVQLFGFRK